MKIIVVSQYISIATGGAERYIHEICSRLESEHGYSIEYISAESVTKSRISGIKHRFFSAGFNIKWYAELKSAFKQYRPDLIYIHYSVPGICDVAFHAARKMKTPCAVMYHSDVTGMGLLKKIIGSLYFEISGKQMMKYCDILFVTSLYYAQNSPFLRKVRRRYIETPPGIDPVMAKGERHKAGRRPYILFVGKPDLREKGFNVLRKAWHALKKKNSLFPDLVVIGDFGRVSKGCGTENGNSAGRPCRKPRMPMKPAIYFTGEIQSRKELANWYASAEATVISSLTTCESFGMVLGEALAAGCPVIGSRIGGIPALIEDGVNGCLVAPGSVEELASALQSVLKRNDEFRKNCAMAKDGLLRKYNWDLTTGIVADCMRSIVSRESITHNAMPSTINASPRHSRPRNSHER